MKKRDLVVLKKIKRYSEEIKCTLQGVDFKQFNSDEQMYRDKRSACSFYLFQIGELAHKLDDSFKKEHTSYNWNGAYRLRNIIGHDYEVIGNESLWQASQQAAVKLLEYVGRLSEGVE